MSKGIVCGCHECHPELEDPGEPEPRTQQHSIEGGTLLVFQNRYEGSAGLTIPLLEVYGKRDPSQRVTFGMYQQPESTKCFDKTESFWVEVWDTDREGDVAQDFLDLTSALEEFADQVRHLLDEDDDAPVFGYPCQSERCSPCRGTVRKRVIPFYRTKIRGHFYEVRGAVIGVCDRCGDHHFAASEVKRWGQLFDDAVRSLDDDKIPF